MEESCKENELEVTALPTYGILILSTFHLNHPLLTYGYSFHLLKSAVTSKHHHFITTKAKLQVLKLTS
jgi:hypothetical protein